MSSASQSSPPSQTHPNTIPSSPLTSKRPQPVPWTQQETIHLIQAYQNKWYSLKRGPLKTNQWEEVAVNVALLCGYDYDHPSKSALQCRHKMEKLRKRYREEKRRVSTTGGACFWPYYHLMDALERGPLPISSRPLELGIPAPAPAPPTVPLSNYYYNGHFNFGNAANNYDTQQFVSREVNYNDYGEEEEGDKERDAEDDYNNGYRTKSRSINYILKKPQVTQAVKVVGKGGIGNGESRVLGEAASKRKRDCGAGVGLGCLAGEIRGLTERMMTVERVKLEMVKETERWRMEMEGKRMEMILGSQRKIVELINAAFGNGSGLRELKVEQ